MEQILPWTGYLTFTLDKQVVLASFFLYKVTLSSNFVRVSSSLNNMSCRIVPFINLNL